MKYQIQIFVTIRKKNDLANCQSRNEKTGQTCQSLQLLHLGCKFQCVSYGATRAVEQYTQPKYHDLPKK